MSVLPQRKSPRLKGYDYSQEGAYFVTICTYNRQCLFGTVADDEMQLNTLGCIAQTCWENIPTHFPHVELDAYVIMPNHMHGIILIIQPPVGTRYIVSEDQSGSGHGTAVSLRGEVFSKPVSGSLSTILRSYKAAVSRQINQTLNSGNRRVWQGRFHDHIIRSQRGLDQLRKYTLYNPSRWQHDKFYPNS